MSIVLNALMIIGTISTGLSHSLLSSVGLPITGDRTVGEEEDIPSPHALPQWPGGTVKKIKYSNENEGRVEVTNRSSPLAFVSSFSIKLFLFCTALTCFQLIWSYDLTSCYLLPQWNPERSPKGGWPPHIHTHICNCFNLIMEWW